MGKLQKLTTSKYPNYPNFNKTHQILSQAAMEKATFHFPHHFNSGNDYFLQTCCLVKFAQHCRPLKVKGKLVCLHPLLHIVLSRVHTDEKIQ